MRYTPTGEQEQIVSDEGTLTPESALAIVEAGGRGAESALAYLATDAFLRRPHEEAQTVAFIDAHLDHCVRYNPGKPNRQHALDRAILVGTMGVSYFMIAQEAYGYHLDHLFTEIGPPGCYVSPEVDRYSDSAQDRFMSSIVQLMTAGGRILEQSKDPESSYARYVPVWQREVAVRDRLQPVNHWLNTQSPVAEPQRHPLNSETIRQTGAQFIRNVMHHLLLAADYTSPSILPLNAVQNTALRGLGAVEVAAYHPRIVQRTAMGVEGAVYKGRRERHGIVPHLVENAAGEPRVAGLEEPPPNPSMCPGPGLHEVPEWLRNDYTPSHASVIGMLTLWGLEVTPYTLYLEQTIEQFIPSMPSGC